ncbi:hypothetical protein [Nocardioides cynanchi]|uniref:hypothetical protein n=1 Tax=Nocardioides cynanchi TaxID=2558918 RepID=UPI0012467519|nr:hypothetical protein [Nocardioides cynanchi]
MGIVLDEQVFRELFNTMSKANPDLMRALCARAMAPGRLLSPTYGHPEAIRWAREYDAIDPLTESVPEDLEPADEVGEEDLPLLTLVSEDE